VTWLQHRGAYLALLALFVVLVVAMVVERIRIDSSYATFVADGCVGHLSARSCNADALTLSGGIDFQTIGTVLAALPVLVGVFLGAPLVAREIESGTFRFAWTQGTRRTQLIGATLSMLGGVITVLAVVLGLVFGGWYAHIYEVVLSPVYSDWQATLFSTTWWMLAVWVLMALAIGTLIGTLIRRTVAAMATTAGALVALVVGGRLLLPQLLHLGAHVTRLAGPVGTMGIGVINGPVQTGWPFPPGSWVARSWLTGSHGQVLGKLVVQHVSFELSSRTARAGERWLVSHHDTFWVAYQPPGHFWMLQGAEGTIVLVVAALCVVATLRLVERRAAS
jgi:ABC-type transport system involved in multi-copper enzyme maturation permease subunit